ncbi:hypothetical protein X728_23190 [Mesorhizobium sp. L103C120A0]|nr:hypothetical protein X728_23190 [Mesorhizobium sp. L103C120A0]
MRVAAGARAHRHHDQWRALRNRLPHLHSHDLDFRADRAGRLQLLARFEGLHGGLSCPADGLEPAGPGRAGRNEANMANYPMARSAMRFVVA